MKYMLKKITTLIITLLLVSVVTFVAFSVIPGDPVSAKLSIYGTSERAEALREEMGLNKPLPERYVDWLSGAVRGDFGESYQYSGVQVSDLVNQRLQVTVLARWEPEGGARRCVSSLLCARLRHVEAILSGASSARSAAFPLSGGMDVKCRIIDRLYPRGSMFRLSIYDVRGERRAIQGERAGGTATKGGHR